MKCKTIKYKGQKCLKTPLIYIIYKDFPGECTRTPFLLWGAPRRPSGYSPPPTLFAFQHLQFCKFSTGSGALESALYPPSIYGAVKSG